MNKLPDNFSLDRYGLHVRLVREEDAEFIVKLRTDSQNMRFIHDTDSSVEKQVDWIRNYKKREEEGVEYYFIFFRDDNPLGVYRLYNLHDGIFTTGSWVFMRACDSSSPILAAIIAIELAFENLNLELVDAFDGCHVDNKKVDKVNRLLGYKETGRIQDVKGEYITYTLCKEDFYQSREKLLKLLS